MQRTSEYMIRVTVSVTVSVTDLLPMSNYSKSISVQSLVGARVRAQHFYERRKMGCADTKKGYGCCTRNSAAPIGLGDRIGVRLHKRVLWVHAPAPKSASLQKVLYISFLHIFKMLCYIYIYIFFIISPDVSIPSIAFAYAVKSNQGCSYISGHESSSETWMHHWQHSQNTWRSAGKTDLSCYLLEGKVVFILQSSADA